MRGHLVADVDALGHDAAELRVVEPVVVRELEPDEAAVRVRVPQPHAARRSRGREHVDPRLDRGGAVVVVHEGQRRTPDHLLARPTQHARGRVVHVGEHRGIGLALQREARGHRPVVERGCRIEFARADEHADEHAVPFPQVEQVERDLGAGTDQADARAARAAGPHLFPGGDHGGAIIRRDQQHRGPAGQRTDLRNLE